MELFAEPVREAGELVPQIVFHALVLPQFNDDRVLQADPVEGRPTGPQRHAQHERVAAFLAPASV
jgi:hypothetical protein